MQVPDSDLSSQAARSKDVISMWMEGNTPRSTRMARQSAYALVGTQISDINVMITLS